MYTNILSAYAFGHPLERPFSWTMAESFGVRVLGVNYRKILTASAAFPAPLLDALAGWDYLTRDLGFAPENITLVGESAGAHLSMQLSRYLADVGTAVPGALALSGPWCDLSPSSTTRPSMTANWGADYIPWLGAIAARAAGRHYTLEAVDGPYFAPVKATVNEWKYLKDHGIKVYVHAGDLEILIDEIRITVAGMKNGGVDVTLVEVSRVFERRERTAALEMLTDKQEADGIHVTATMSKIFPTSNAWEVFKTDVHPIVHRKY
jgi:acetyl esterase/lipase